MSKCRHQNSTIVEEFMVYSFFDFEGGLLTHLDHTPEGGNYTGMFNVKCRDCGYRGRFSRIQNRHRPKWLNKMLDQIDTAGRGEEN